MSEPKAFSVCPVFMVGNVRRAIDWYRDALGWELGFVWPEGGEAPTHAAVRFGDATIHLSHCDNLERRGRASAYVFITGVDAYSADIQSRGTELDYGPEDTDYDMRELGVIDPDGNRLSFGQGI